MGALGNFIWILSGGLVSAVLWCLAGAAMFITVIGAPWSRSCFTLANLALMPFGREAVHVRMLTGEVAGPSALLGAIGSAVWFVLGGWYLGLGHAVAGLACCITVIGIPFGMQHFKLGGLALAPLGRRIVPKDQAKLLRAEAAQMAIARARGLA